MASPQKIVIGTRGSQLALWQTHWVKDRLSHSCPDLDIQIEVIQTKGDKILDAALSKIGDKGLFTREIEHQLLQGSIDLAVHSLKDLPTVLPDGLTIGAISHRENPADALVSKNNLTLDQLPPAAIVLTSSLRRKAQLLMARPDLQIHDVRGNIQTRLNKFDAGPASAIILASAGLIRLNLDHRITQSLDPNSFLPAVGQGALAIEIRQNDPNTQSLIRTIHHQPTALCCRTERALLHHLEGGCQIPIGAFAQIQSDQLHLHALIADVDGSCCLKTSDQGPLNNPEKIGIRAAENLILQGARDFLDPIRYNKP